MTEPRWGRRRPDTRTDEDREQARRHQERVERARGTMAVLVEVRDDGVREAPRP